jgi:hypothetical protein
MSKEQIKRYILRLLDTLPDEQLREVADFVEFLRERQRRPICNQYAFDGMASYRQSEIIIHCKANLLLSQIEEIVKMCHAHLCRKCRIVSLLPRRQRLICP